jgi:steroid delta-isomerase-like uncharacterized protein
MANAFWGGNPMSMADNKALVQRFLEEVWNQGNLAVVDEMVSSDYVDHIAPPGWPAGPAGLKQAVVRNRTAFPDLHYTIDDLLADGDRVMTRWTWRGTHQGKFRNRFVGTIQPTGTRVKVSGMSIRRIADGKIAELWGYSDSLTLLEQLGAITPARQAARGQQLVSAARSTFRATQAYLNGRGSARSLL